MARWFCSRCGFEAVSNGPMGEHPRCPNGCNPLIERNPDYEIPKRRNEPVQIGHTTDAQGQTATG